ncbi:MAG: serine kinase [Bacillota bacterium]
MLLSLVARELSLKPLTSDLAGWEDIEVKGGFCSDLLSVVMAEAAQGDLWITRQVHLNVIAVAALGELAGIIVSGKMPAPETIAKAVIEKVPMFYSQEPAFTIAGKLYCLLNSDS